MTTTTKATAENPRDLVKEQRALYRATAKPSLVEVPPLRFLQADGVGSPSDAGFAVAIQAVYSVGYTLRFLARADGVVDYKVPPLEALWWAEDLDAFLRGAKEEWEWRLLLRVPDEIGEAEVERARPQARVRSGDAVDAVRLDCYDEGHAAQVLHVGPYATEGPTIIALHEFIAAQGLERRGPHHEIYLGDPRRTQPDRLRTLIRQPVT